MRVSRMLGGGAVLATLAILPELAMADVTAADVWADWQAGMQERGTALTATLERSPGRITLSDILLTSTSPVASPGQAGTLRLSRITLVEEGGTVAIRLPDEQPLRIEGNDGPHHAVMDWQLRNPGLDLRASGDPQDIIYRYVAPTVSMTLEQMTRDGAPVAHIGMDVALRIGGAEGQQRSTLRDGMREFVSANRIAQMEASASLVGAETGQRIDGGFAIADLVSSYTGRGPTGTFDATRMLRESEMEASFSHGALDASFNRGDAIRLTMHAVGGQGETALLNGRLTHASSLNAGEIAFSAAGLPDPPGLTFDAMTSSLALPLAQSDTAQPYALAVSLDNFVGNAAAWELFDPDTVLPRDPGQFTLDLSGRMRVTGDLAAASRDEVPLAFETIDINALMLAVAGARLTGTGAFTVADNASLPVGSADLVLAGGERLLDGLVRIGLVPPGQAMMVRMMVGGFTRPGEAPDTLTSHIEVRDDGSILANGRPLR